MGDAEFALRGREPAVEQLFIGGILAAGGQIPISKGKNGPDKISWKKIWPPATIQKDKEHNRRYIINLMKHNQPVFAQLMLAGQPPLAQPPAMAPAPAPVPAGRTYNTLHSLLC